MRISSLATNYLPDAGGNRVKKLVRVSGGNYTSTTYIDGIFEHLTDGTDIQNTLHVMDDKSRIATIRLGYDFGDTTPAVKYVLEDHMGNSTREINGDGTFISKEEYYPFGETSFASYGKKRYKYNGKERDEESGMYNYGMRYYSAWTCRFVSVDPLASKYSFYTPYQYAGNKPIIAIDVDGMEDKQVLEPKSKSNGQTAKTQPDTEPLVEATGSKFHHYVFNNKGEIVSAVPCDKADQFSILEHGTVDPSSPDLLFPVYHIVEIDLESDLGKMARAVYGEAGGETEHTKGKVISEEAILGVAEVIRNRAQDRTPNSEKYGWNRYFSSFNTYSEVIENTGFDATALSKYKDPVAYYTDNKNPEQAKLEFLKSISAAIKAHFQNTNTTQGALYMLTPAVASKPSSWKGVTAVSVPGVDSNTEFTFYKFQK